MGLIHQRRKELGKRNVSHHQPCSTIELMVYVDAGVQNDATQNGFSVVEYTS